jgi:methionyl-tRNA formyltransferase
MSPHIPRIAFMGTPDFSVHILKALLKAPPYHVVAVYTQPPRPVGRGYKVTPSPVQMLASLHNISLFTPASLKTEEVQEQWKALDLAVGIVAAYGLILPKAILETPSWGCVNVHASLLPRWRGAAPIQRALLAGDKETGITIMKMNEGLDTGDILLMEKTPLHPSTTTLALFNSLAHLGAEALLRALPLYLDGRLHPIPQPQEGVTYAKKLEKKEGLLDWRLSATLLERKIRVLNPWPGTWFDIGKDRLKVLEADIVSHTGSQPPGTILDDQLTIACGEGALRLLWVQKVGRTPLPAKEFLRGYDLPSLCMSHGTI